MINTDPKVVDTILQIIEILGTLAFAISGIRHAAARHYDWFGGFVCGIAVAIGGGTLRDVMLNATPFWMTSPMYILCTLMAQFIVIVFARSLKRLDNAWFAFDTLGLALFTIAGLQRLSTMGIPSGWPLSWAASRVPQVECCATYCSIRYPLSSARRFTPWLPSVAEYSIGS